MYIILVVPTITQYKRLHTMLQTVKESTRRPDRVVVLDNGNACPPDLNFDGLHDVWINNPTNKGVAGSCNQALSFASIYNDGWWLHANDDIEVGPNSIEMLERAAKAQPEALMFNPACAAGSAFTFFLMPARRALKEIGLWDEEFFPAYYEDNDYAYRMSLKGYRHIDIECDGYVHHTSSTKKAYTDAEIEWGHSRFRANRQRYIDKWAPDVDDKTGNPIWGTERFKTPFGISPYFIGA